jgi:hypothetical protein
LRKEISFRSWLLTAGLALSAFCNSQMITGVWQGKINREKVEVKIIQNGDSLTGTSYYFENPSHYRRYSIKGYFDSNTNEAVWWDDQLIEEKSGRSGTQPGILPMLSRADFNCPGDGRMMLDGKSGRRDALIPSKDLHLDKKEDRFFTDEWDFVIDNYLTGANDPWIIDSVAAISYEQPITLPAEEPIIVTATIPKAAPPVAKTEKQEETRKPLPAPTIEQKFVTRKKVLVTEIPLAGDSIELRFYDNAEIDGDSISLFLNDKLIFSHIRLLGSAYTVKLAVKELGESNELTMVAENLGSIPPNTSYMVAIVEDKRYEARLESTEGSSAMIRFVKK